MRKWFLPLVCLFWLLFVVVIYYSGHKPAEPGVLLAVLLAAWRLLAAGLLTALAGGLGARLWMGEGLHPLARLALQAGLGFGLLGLGVLLVGALLGLPAWLPWAALPVLLFLLRRQVVSWLQGWRGLAGLWHESGRFERCLAALLAVIFAVTLGVALAPPIHFDSLVYHFVLPDAYLRDAKVAYLPWIVMSGMPQTAELLYSWVIALAGSEAAAVLCWGFGLLAVLGLLGVLRQAWDARAAWVGAAALLAGFTPAWLLSGGYVDWLVFLEALGALVMLAAWRKSGARESLVWAGLFTGLAVGSKYTSVVLALAGVAALTWHAVKRRAAWLPVMLPFGLAALAAGLPWFVKNAFTTGNPFYPFFLSGGAMNTVRLQVYQHLPAWGSWLDLVFLPVRATSLGFEAGDGFMFAPGMLLLGLGGLAWLLALRQPEEDANASLPAVTDSPPSPGPHAPSGTRSGFLPEKGGRGEELSLFAAPWRRKKAIKITPPPLTRFGCPKGQVAGAGGWVVATVHPQTMAPEGDWGGALLATAGVLAVAGVVFWALGNQYSGNLIQTRYYFSIFPAFAVLAAAGDCGLRRIRLSTVRMGRIAAALILLALSLNCLEVTQAGLKNGAPQTALGLKSSQAYLADALGWFEPAMTAVRALPEGQRAQLIYEPRSLYCAPRCLPDEILDRWKRLWLSLGDDPAAIRQALTREGITHLLVYREGVRFLQDAADPHHPPTDLAALDKFLQTLPQPVDFGGVYALYSISSP